MLTKMKMLLAQEFSPQLPAELGWGVEKVIELLEIPKDSAHGDLAFPCFQLSKLLKKAPLVIAQELAQKKIPHGFKKIQPMGGYLNFFFDDRFWQDLLFNEMQNEKDNYGNLKIGKGQVVVIDYSSPNVAKPMSIGHLRSTVIGQALVNLFNAADYKTVGINYIGDWGVQFGKLAWAHLNIKELLKLSEKHGKHIIEKGFNPEFWQKLLHDAKTSSHHSFDYLFAIYVIFHAVEEFEPVLENHGREYFLKLERRKTKPSSSQEKAVIEQIVQAWQEFIDISLIEYQRVYKLLGTKHDLVRGESFYEEHLPQVVAELKNKALLVESQGAMVVDLNAYNMPPCLIQKSDGATLYATRDIAAALNRKSEFKADKMIYVVGSEQTLHFRQVFKVLELMRYPWASHCEHVSFGLYRFKEGKMSTRRGNVVLLEDVLDKTIDLVKEIIKEKNPDLKNSEQVAQSVGTGAVIFNDLMNDRQKNIDFDWEKLLDFNGDTGPYVQYAHARCCSVLAKSGNKKVAASQAVLLETTHEKEVLKILGRFEDAIRISVEQLKPSWMAQYLLELCKAFNFFYFEHRILEGPEDLQASRLMMVEGVRLVLAKGLRLLGISAPQAM